MILIRPTAFALAALIAFVAATGSALATESQPAAKESTPARSYTKNVAILIYPGVEILDFGGPSEVFASAAGIGGSDGRKAFNCYTVSKTKAPIVSQGFIDVTPDYSIEDCPKPDILVIPGGGSGSVTSDAAWMEWVKSAGGGAEHVLTVCTGAFIAGKAGFLDGLDATTWYGAVDRLAKQYPNTHVQPGRRFIDNGKVITTAGVSAGIDGSLHLVARLLGQYVAGRTAEYMEYKWAPEPYLSEKYSQLNPQLDERGRALQQASIAMREGNKKGALATYRSLIAAHHDDAGAWLSLGRALHEMGRYPEAMAAHLEAVKAEGVRAEAYYNLACEYSLTGACDKAIDAAQKAVQAGFRQKGAFESDTDLAAIRDDARFKALLATL